MPRVANLRRELRPDPGAAHRGPTPLTPREHEIVMLIAQGRRRAEGSEQRLWEAFHLRERLFLRVRGDVERARAAVAAVEGLELRSLTAEPDGTHRVYWLRVPPHTRTAREGVAWTFGLGVEEYQPMRQT